MEAVKENRESLQSGGGTSTGNGTFLLLSHFARLVVVAEQVVGRK